jgi:cytoskeletal protein CcmA (bactofilin family)
MVTLIGGEIGMRRHDGQAATILGAVSTAFTHHLISSNVSHTCQKEGARHMLGLSKDDLTQNDRVPSLVQQLQRAPVAASEALKSADEISSISSSITIVGKISGTGTVRICGHIEGELRASTVLIDDGAQVEGDIVAEELIIGGGVKGTIHANRVKLNGSAIVEGDIFHRSLSIDENARFEGSSRREETVIDAPRIPIIRPEAQADVDTVVAMEGSRKHNGPLENKWRANE